MYVCVLVYIYWVSGLYLLYTSLLGTGDTQRDYIFIIYMSELPFSFRCRQDWTKLHFASFPVPMHLGTISIKLNMEVTARVEWEEDGIGEDTGSFKYIDNVFLRLAGGHMGIHCIHLYTFFAWWLFCNKTFKVSNSFCSIFVNS